MILLKTPWDAFDVVIYCHLDLVQGDMETLRKELADGFTKVEKWDLLVTSVELRVKDGFLVVEAYPDVQYRPGEKEHNGFEPVPVVTSIACFHCTECGAEYMASRMHPQNECNFGIVDNVIRS